MDVLASQLDFKIQYECFMVGYDGVRSIEIVNFYRRAYENVVAGEVMSEAMGAAESGIEFEFSR